MWRSYGWSYLLQSRRTFERKRQDRIRYFQSLETDSGEFIAIDHPGGGGYRFEVLNYIGLALILVAPFSLSPLALSA